MNNRRSSPLRAWLVKFGSTRPGAWFFSRTLHHFDRAFLKLSGGRETLSGVLTGQPVVFVTTWGARTGLPRTLPLLCIRSERTPGVIALVASNWGQAHDPAWYFNLKANPRAAVSIDGISREYAAHEASGEEYAEFWRCAAEAYAGYPVYKQRAAHRRIPIVVLEPVKP